MNASRPLGARRLVGALILFAVLVPHELSAQSGGARSLFSSGPSLGPPVAGTAAPGASIVSPGVAAPGVIQAVPPAGPAGSGLSGQVTLTLAARFGRDMPITGAVDWRIFTDKPDAAGVFRLVKEDKSPSPSFALPPGGYVVHCAFGLASAVKPVVLRSEPVREVLDVPAGGLVMKGQVGDVRIPPGQISFEVYPGSQFEPGEKKPLAQGIMTGEMVLLPEGTYHIVSNYGDTNAIVRSDIRVQVGKLTDVTITHRAAVITLKLVSEKGGEALANTAWTVLTPSGDVVKESIGAFPRVVLNEGEYKVIARNEGRAQDWDFKVTAGVDGEVEVVLAH
ncbi:MAG: hypothetical protein ACLPKB_08320 [Xanthobacteraceae bacterium]